MNFKLKFIKKLEKTFRKEVAKNYGKQAGLFCNLEDLEYSLLGDGSFVIEVKGNFGRYDQDTKKNVWEKPFTITLYDMDKINNHLAGRFSQVLEEIDLKDYLDEQKPSKKKN